MAKIPSKKHSSDELSAIRSSVAVQQSAVNMADTYNKKMVGKPLLVLGYVCALFSPFWLLVLSLKGSASYGYSMTDVTLMAAFIVLAILVALLIFFKRTLSRHHSSFITIVALLSVFSIVYMLSKDKQLKAEVMELVTGEVAPARKNKLSPDSQAELDKKFDKQMEKNIKAAEKKSQQ